VCVCQVIYLKLFAIPVYQCMCSLCSMWKWTERHILLLLLLFKFSYEAKHLLNILQKVTKILLWCLHCQAVQYNGCNSIPKCSSDYFAPDLCFSCMWSLSTILATSRLLLPRDVVQLLYVSTWFRNALTHCVASLHVFLLCKSRFNVVEFDCHFVNLIFYYVLYSLHSANLLMCKCQCRGGLLVLYFYSLSSIVVALLSYVWLYITCFSSCSAMLSVCLSVTCSRRLVLSSLTLCSATVGRCGPPILSPLAALLRRFVNHRYAIHRNATVTCLPGRLICSMCSEPG